MVSPAISTGETVDQIRIRAILDGARDAFVEVDFDQRITEWNSRSETAFAWARAEVLGQPAHILVPSRHRAAFDAKLRHMLDAGDGGMAPDNPMRLRWIRRDGVEFSAELIAAPVRQGSTYGLASWIRDLTDRERIQSTARERQEHEAILNFIDDGYAEVDLDGNYLFVNDAYCRIFGRTRAGVLSASYKEFFNPETAGRVREVFRTVYETGEPVRGFEYEYRPGRFAETSIALRRDPQGRPIGFVAVSRDTTERKRYERELASAKEAAEAASRAKSDFLANMSHEIRTPMNGVIAMTAVLLDTELSAEQREFAEMVRKSGEALLTLINDILDFSKIEAGRLEVEYRAFDLLAVLEDVMEMLSPKAAQKRLDLVLEYPAHLPRLFVGDAGRIRQVVTNLAGNALKFTEHGYVRLEVHCEEPNADGSRMRVTVIDTGIGISPEKIPALFEKFTQADASITRRYGGTGLGLTISKQLVELMGGSIQVVSQIGQGSTFSFVLALPFETGSQC